MNGSMSRKKWETTATPEQIEFVNAVFKMCTENYENGGDTIVECYDPEDVLKQFKTLDEVKVHCGLLVENATNFREGNDNDPELDRLERFKEWQ